MKLTEPTEEVMTFYGRMIDHDYTTMDTFNKNFLKVSASRMQDQLIHTNAFANENEMWNRSDFVLYEYI